MPGDPMSASPIANDQTEMERMQARVRRLAEEKSYLQLIVRLIEQINPRPGVHDMVNTMLHNIMETIGGTNIKIWYWFGEDLCFAQFFGEGRDVVTRVDDPLVEQVMASRSFVEVSGDAADALLRGHLLPGAWTWCFPLLVGDELIGVVKLENVNIVGAGLRAYLPIFWLFR
jgi:hypothetical protein